MSRIYDHPTPMLNWLETTEAKIFFEDREERLTSCQRKLEKVSDPVEMYRLQGRIEELNDLIGLYDGLKMYLRDKTNGKRGDAHGVVR